jgi:hypothetical protein
MLAWPFAICHDQSQADVDTMPLDLQNYELNKPLFFTKFPASDILL